MFRTNCADFDNLLQDALLISGNTIIDDDLTMTDGNVSPLPIQATKYELVKREKDKFSDGIPYAEMVSNFLFVELRAQTTIDPISCKCLHTSKIG